MDIGNEIRSVRIGGKAINYRVATTDLNIIKEVFGGGYRRSRRFSFDVEQGETWLDLGGHIGAFSVYCENRGGRSIAFEPISENIAMFILNCPTAILHESAVTASDAKTIIIISPDPTRKGKFCSSSTLAKLGDKTKVMNTCINNTPPIDCIKMDIEGSEFEILDKKLIPSCKKLVLEYHFRKDRLMGNFKRRMEYLRLLFPNVYYPPELDGYSGSDLYRNHYDKTIFCWT